MTISPAKTKLTSIYPILKASTTLYGNAEPHSGSSSLAAKKPKTEKTIDKIARIRGKIACINGGDLGSVVNPSTR
ncbi:MAG TPA: hypothetical protein ENJ59_02730 [Thermofilum sp.]|nr:hypothetical protein [Thermofilum sp.]